MYAYVDCITGTRSLLSLVYDTKASDLSPAHLKYSAYKQNGGPYSPKVFTNEEIKSRLFKYQIPNPGTFVPERMEVRERPQRQEKDDTRRIVLLRDDKTQYKVFKFADASGTDGDVPMS
jgi:anaphase-promoting complex subunit 4